MKDIKAELKALQKAIKDNPEWAYIDTEEVCQNIYSWGLSPRAFHKNLPERMGMGKEEFIARYESDDDFRDLIAELEEEGFNCIYF